MSKKIKENQSSVYILPSNNKDLTSFTRNNKVEMMEQVISSIEFSVDNNLPVAEVFQFKNSDFVITILETDYLINIDHILSYYMKTEVYEYCKRLVSLREKIVNHVGQTINNEK